MKAKTIINGVARLHLYRGGGDESSILLLHGLSFDARSLSGLTARLPKEIECWVTDFRGHGNSARTPGPYLYRDLVDDTIAVIRDGIGKPVYLFGHSLGGAVALAAASQEPEWVRGLIISDNFLTRESYATAIRQPLVRALFTGLSDLAGRRLGAAGTARALADLPLPGPDGRTIPLGQFPGNSPVFLSIWAEALTRCDPEAVRLTLEEANYDAFMGEAYLERLQCPMLLLQADPALGGMLPDNDVEAARGIRPDLDLRKFPGTGHFMHLHEPEPTAKAVSDFIQGKPRPGP